MLGVEVEPRIVGGKATRQIAAGKQCQRPVPQDQRVARRNGKRAIVAFDRQLIIAFAELKQAEIVVRLRPARFEIEGAPEGGSGTVEVERHPEHVAKIGPQRRRGGCELHGAPEARDRRRQTAHALQQHRNVVVGIGEIRSQLERAHIKIDGALGIAGILTLQCGGQYTLHLSVGAPVLSSCQGHDGGRRFNH